MKVLPINNSFNYTNVTFEKRSKNASQIQSDNSIQKQMLIPTVGFLMSGLIPNVVLANYPVDDDKSVKVETVQYTEDFKLNGKMYTMFFSDDSFSEDEKDNVVADIYFVPQDETAKALKLEHLYYHRGLDNGEDKVIAVVIEQNPEGSPEKPPQEIVLPTKIGKELLDLYRGVSEFYLLPDSNTYTEISSQ